MAYHCFLAYSSRHRAEAEVLVQYLRNSGVSVFWDIDLLPGSPHRKVIERNLRESLAVVVLIGPGGLGPWQEGEVDTAYWDLITGQSDLRLIPVLLPGAGLGDAKIPAFLRNYTACFFKSTAQEPEVIQALIAGIMKDQPVGISDQYELPLSRREYNDILQRTVQTYNSIAATYYERWKDDLPEGPINTFLNRLPLRATVLDAGCGPGHHARFLHHQGYEVTGIDLSDEALQIARKTAIGSAFLQMDMRELDDAFPPNSFDGVWAAASCVHTTQEQLDAQVAQFVRLTKPKGIIGVTLQIEGPARIKDDGRFFESYRSKADVERHFEGLLEIIATTEETTTGNTFDLKKVKRWVAIIGRVPEKKLILQSPKAATPPV